MSKSIRPLALSVALACLAHSAFAQEGDGITADFNGEGVVKTKITGITPDAVPVALEDGISIIGKINVNGLFEVVGVVRTGSTYGSASNTFYNSTAAPGSRFTPSTAMALRNLYVQKTYKDYLFQIGALQPDNGMANKTGLSSNGWVDGGRVKIKTEYGDIMVTGGQLSTNDKPDAFGRIADLNLNYIELVVSTTVFEKLGIQVGAEEFNGEIFAKAAVKYDLALTTEKIIKLVTDAMVNADTGSFMLSAGLSTDIVSLINGESSGVILAANYIYRTTDATGRMADYRSGIDACVGNHCGVFNLTVPVTKDKKLSVYVAARVEQDSVNNRYEGGVKVAFGAKKK